MKRGGPKGGGWKEDELPPGSGWRQWSYPGAVRKEFPEYTLIALSNGRRTYSGIDGGALVFDGKGGVGVHWNFAAVIASRHGSGNRKNPITISQGNRLPPKLSPQAKFVTDIRALFIIPEDHTPEGQSDIPGLPDAANDPDAIELTKLFQAECYHLLSAVVRGDATEFRRIADWLELSERIRTGEEDVPETYSDIAEAVREAAIKADGIPTRAAVEKEFNALVGANREGKNLREDLGRMGFGWIHGATGRPPRKVGETRGQ
jgi:hypothetical protein